MLIGKLLALALLICALVEAILVLRSSDDGIDTEAGLSGLPPTPPEDRRSSL